MWNKGSGGGGGGGGGYEGRLRRRRADEKREMREMVYVPHIYPHPSFPGVASTGGQEARDIA